MNPAIEQDRDIFAVPGPLDAPLSEGTNYLIQQGAKLVTCGGDILSEYWARFPRRLAASAPLTPEAAQAGAAGGVAHTLIPCDLRERNVPLIFPSSNLEVFQSCQIKRI